MSFPFLHFKDFNVFCQEYHSLLYISKTSMSFVKTITVFFTFQRLQCLLSRLSQSSLRFQKTTMSSFTFQILQCLQSLTLSKDDNVFIYISKDFKVFSHLHFQKMTMYSFTFQKTSMSSIIYAFKRRQYLNLHFKKLQMSSVIYAFERLQCLHLYFKHFNVFFLLQ